MTPEQLTLRRQAEQTAFEEFGGLHSDQVKNYKMLFGRIDENGQVAVREHLPMEKPRIALDSDRDGVPDKKDTQGLYPPQANDAYAVALRVQQLVTAQAEGSIAPAFNKEALIKSAEDAGIITSYMGLRSFNEGGLDKLVQVGNYNFTAPTSQPVETPKGDAIFADTESQSKQTAAPVNLAALKDLALGALPGLAMLNPMTQPLGVLAAPLGIMAATSGGKQADAEMVGPPEAIPANELAGPPAPGQAPAVAPKAPVAFDQELEGLPASEQQRIAAMGAQVTESATVTHTVKAGDSLDKIIRQNYPELGRDGIGYLAVRLAIETKNPENKNIFMQDRFELRADAGEIKLPNLDEVKGAFTNSGKTYAAAQQDICEALDCAPTQVASQANAESKGIRFA